MGKKIKKEQNGEEEQNKLMSINDIRNRIIKRKLVHQELTKKKKLKKEERKRRKDAGEAPGVPHTIESLRVKDETVLDPIVPGNEEKIEEVKIDVQTDNFESYFNMEYVPKVLITFCDNPTQKSHKEINKHRPEVILNNFTTRLGTSVARMLASLFHYDPEFKGRRVVTFHNQRDYIFFRHHRYQFNKDAKPQLKELGPRFTLRLEYIQEGTFDTILGDYEWVKSGRRHSLESNRRKFYL
uniref:Brix domain-containing protein n=1 Tax=Rhodnius prolixus TaxID=13249 RepID=T1HZK0_RHOPR